MPIDTCCHAADNGNCRRGGFDIVVNRARHRRRKRSDADDEDSRNESALMKARTGSRGEQTATASIGRMARSGPRRQGQRRLRKGRAEARSKNDKVTCPIPCWSSRR